MDNDISVEIARLYVSFFNRAPDPEGLQYWMERYAAEVENGQDAALFLEEIADSFAQSPEAKAIYEQEADPGRSQIEAYITEAYFNMFGREPDDEGLAYWAERWETEMDAGRPGVRVLFEIENAARNSTNQNDIDALNNKAEVAAKFTTDFIESGAEWSDEAFEAASTILDDVDHTDESVQQAAEEIEQVVVDNGGELPDAGQNPGGGGAPRPMVANLDDAGVLTIAEGADAEVSTDGTNYTITAQGHRALVITPDDAVGSIVIENGAVLNVDGDVAAVLTDNFANAITGAGALNLTNVSFVEASGNGADDDTKFDSSLDVDLRTIEADVIVNGSRADYFKVAWDYVDDNYSYYNTSINEYGVRIGLEYLNYINNGGDVLTNVVVKADDNGRSQSMHDNLLGNLHIPSIEDKFFSSPTGSNGGANGTADNELGQELIDLVQNAFNDMNAGWRPIYSGQPNATFEAVAWDYTYGIDRPDAVLRGTNISEEDFNEDLVWQDDRTAPESVQWDESVVTFSIDLESDQTGFYRYQGSKLQEEDGDYLDLNPGTIFNATLHVEEDWATDEVEQQTGIWIQQQNSAGDLDGGGRFSIAEYIDEKAAEALNIDGFTGGFRFWNSDEGWSHYHNWDSPGDVNLTFGFFGDEQVWFINGEQVYRYWGESTEEVDVLETVIFNSVNFGSEQQYKYSDISFTGFEIA